MQPWPALNGPYNSEEAQQRLMPHVTAVVCLERCPVTFQQIDPKVT